MDIGKSLTYYFDDPRWVNKLAIGTGVLILSSIFSVVLIGLIGYLIIIGYALDTLRNVRNGEQYPMPEWKDRWGEWLVQGFRLTVATLVWALPAIIVGIAAVIPAALTGSNSDFWITMGGLGIACLSCLIGLWSIIVVLALPGISIRIAETEKLSAGLAFGDILAFTRQHLGDVIIVSIVYVVAAMLLSLLGTVVGALLCGVGLFVTMPLATMITYLIQAHLYALIGISGGTTLATSDDTTVSPAPEPAPAMVAAPVVETETTAPTVQPDDQPPAPESE
ncbi:MAG: DUF4013 domain-containing protein [Anaerolineae bacterium]|nr:DUF4013 domain-containing protein [Anaerolineae bacterium]MCB0207207.1 DUF4013 domain-containing protein [Anaerolineae bacterium]MCB0256617.1 DUF4013 domain-containing protein [Anaerolineae bacterium]